MITPAEMRTAHSRLDLTQVAAARFLGVDGRTMRRWLSGEATVPRAVEIAIEMCLRAGGVPADLMPEKDD